MQARPRGLHAAAPSKNPRPKNVPPPHKRIGRAVYITIIARELQGWIDGLGTLESKGRGRPTVAERIARRQA